MRTRLISSKTGITFLLFFQVFDVLKEIFSLHLPPKYWCDLRNNTVHSTHLFKERKHGEATTLVQLDTHLSQLRHQVSITTPLNTCFYTTSITLKKKSSEANMSHAALDKTAHTQLPCCFRVVLKMEGKNLYSSDYFTL